MVHKLLKVAAAVATGPLGAAALVGEVAVGAAVNAATNAIIDEVDTKGTGNYGVPPEEEWDKSWCCFRIGRVYIDGIRYDRMSELPRDISPEARDFRARRQELFNAQFFNEWNVEKVEKK